MAKCPGGCGRNWQWDWGTGTYRLETGEMCIDTGEGNPCTALICFCGVSLWTCDEKGNVSTPWKGVDWDMPPHYYNGNGSTIWVMCGASGLRTVDQAIGKLLLDCSQGEDE